ncbi:LOW QUALITY PROTEIN: hypothetical protein U9M48_008557 [Paspalum notatum var. saurae]|uniref:Uncharacterized protein n=1 Tax=Paspalum notatum var. saurae TaxID=547442 RepID=A0AAQ3SPD4_PASNO
MAAGHLPKGAASYSSSPRRQAAAPAAFFPHPLHMQQQLQSILPMAPLHLPTWVSFPRRLLAPPADPLHRLFPLAPPGGSSSIVPLLRQVPPALTPLATKQRLLPLLLHAPQAPAATPPRRLHLPAGPT